MNSKAIRVMVLSNSLNTGGAERFASSLLLGLPAADIHTFLVVLRPDIAYPLPDETRVQVLDYNAPWDLPRVVWRLRRSIRRIQPDVLLGVSSSVNVVAGLALATMAKRPAWIARVDIALQRRDLWLRRILLSQLHRFADRVVANSHGLGRSISTASPWLKTKVMTCYSPVAFDQFESFSRCAPAWRRTKTAPLLVTVGRACHGKRWDIILKAFSRVVQTREAELVFCGDGVLMDKLQALAHQLNLTHCVHFLGRCDNPFAILAQADLFILGSEAEGLPNALIEAQGLGLCAVATRCCYGPSEIVTHGQTGLLTAVNDSDAMARAVETLLVDETQRKRMGANAREKMRRQFDYRARCLEWEHLIRQVAAG